MGLSLDKSMFKIFWTPSIETRIFKELKLFEIDEKFQNQYYRHEWDFDTLHVVFTCGFRMWLRVEHFYSNKNISLSCSHLK
jgi:hypothetical protein